MMKHILDLMPKNLVGKNGVTSIKLIDGNLYDSGSPRMIITKNGHKETIDGKENIIKKISDLQKQINKKQVNESEGSNTDI